MALFGHANPDVLLDVGSQLLKGAAVTVRPKGDAVTLAAIYSTPAGTPKSNPFNTDATSGTYDFYALPGHYDLWVGPSKVATITIWRDPADADDELRPEDYGAYADGNSHPLSGLYGSLAAAQAVYPHATALTNEIDWAAAQAATLAAGVGGAVRYRGHLITNKMVAPLDDQVHFGLGATIENRALRYVAPDAYDAACFEVGNMHPQAMNPSLPSLAWATHGLDPVTAGDTTITVTTPAGVSAPLAAGDIVAICSSNNNGGVSVTHDFSMWNRVVSWNAVTGAMKLEVPVPVSMVTTASTFILGGPVVKINAASDVPRGVPWKVSQRVTIRDFELIGIAPLHSRTAGWRCVIKNIVADCDHLISCNAMAFTHWENIKGRFQERMMEVKQFTHNSVFRSIYGAYKYSSAINPKTIISVGEQAYDNTFDDIDCEVGSDYPDAHRALEIWAPDNYFRGRLRHNGSGGHTEDWAIKSTLHTARGPSGTKLDLQVRTRVAKQQFGVIGNTIGASTVADPSGGVLTLDQFSEGAHDYAARIPRGADLRLASCVGSAVEIKSIAPGEVPTGATVLLFVANAATYAASAEVILPGGPFAMRGPKTGDAIKVALQLASTGAIAAGSLGSLHATAAVNTDGLVIVYIRNRSAVAVTTTGAPALNVLASWEKNRL